MTSSGQCGSISSPTKPSKGWVVHPRTHILTFTHTGTHTHTLGDVHIPGTSQTKGRMSSQLRKDHEPLRGGDILMSPQRAEPWLKFVYESSSRLDQESKSSYTEKPLSGNMWAYKTLPFDRLLRLLDTTVFIVSFFYMINSFVKKRTERKKQHSILLYHLGRCCD